MSDRRIDSTLALAVAAVGFLATWQAGRIGFYALDQSIVFDGAWRVLSGQIPWRDFVLPAGLTPVLMQAAVFAVFGVSWSSYVLHAAFVNAAASAIVYVFLRRCSLGRIMSAGCAIVTAATLYPPNGTPYLETHALFFSIAALCLAKDAASAPLSWVRWIAIAGCAVFAALSKQIPTGFIVPVLAVLIGANQDGVSRRMNVRCAAAACGTVVAIGAVMFAAAGVSFGLFWTHYLRLPLAIGANRHVALGRRLEVAAESAATALPLTNRLFAAMVIVFVTVVVGGLLRARKTARVPPMPAGGALVIIALWLMMSTWLFVVLTNNEPQQAFGLIGLAAGLAMAGVCLSGKAVGSDVLSPFSPWRAGPRVRAVVVVVGAAGLLADAVHFHRVVNLPRTAHEMHVDLAGWGTWSADARMSRTMKEVGFSLWTAQSQYTSAATSLPLLIEHLRDHAGNFLMMGDETVIYGLTGRPSPTPFLWFHPGLVWEDTPLSHARINASLEEGIRRYDVRTIVVPANFGVWPWRTWTFDAIASRMSPLSACPSVGDYLLCPLGPP